MLSSADFPYACIIGYRNHLNKERPVDSVGDVETNIFAPIVFFFEPAVYLTSSSTYPEHINGLRWYGRHFQLTLSPTLILVSSFISREGLGRYWIRLWWAIMLPYSPIDSCSYPIEKPCEWKVSTGVSPWNTFIPIEVRKEIEPIASKSLGTEHTSAVGFSCSTGVQEYLAAKNHSFHTQVIG